jgi:hypothetical protein
MMNVLFARLSSYWVVGILINGFIAPWSFANAPIGVPGVLLSSFEGNLSSSLGVDWEIYDTAVQTPGNQSWGISYASATGVTEGIQALQLTHPSYQWQHGLKLQTASLISLVTTYDTLEFDITANPDAIWSLAWVIMDGDGFPWSMTAPIDLVPGQTTHVSIDMSMPNPTESPQTNWKASAAASGGAWWRLTFALQGNDAASNTTYTILDNVRFGVAVPECSAFCLIIVSGFGLLIARRRI